MNEMRNELLMIMQIEKEENAKDKKLRVKWLLERFEDDIKTQLKDIEYKKEQLESNLETLEYIRKELGVE